MNLRIASATLLMTWSVAIPAQSARPGVDSLPRELVEALLRPYYGFYPASGSAFVVGHVPASLAPYFFVPPGSRVLGGIETPSTTIVVLSTSMSTEELRAAYRREQLRLGWAPASAAGYRGWGFVPAPGASPDGGLVFCHIGQSLQIMPYQSPSQPLVVTATVQNYGSQCSSQVRMMTPSSVMELPVLMNPQDAAMNDRVCLGSNNTFAGGNGTGERLQTNLSPTQLLDHFSRQLADSGWSASPPVAGVRRVWTRPDTGGMSRELTLTITPLSSAGCQDLSLQVRRVPGR